MKYTFVITEQLNKPVGGYKVVFGYCNHLAKKGNSVTIVYDYEFALQRHKKLPNFIKKLVYSFRYKSHLSWIYFDKNVTFKKVWRVTNCEIPDADYIFATAIDTSFVVKELDSSKGKKIYLIQGFENWNCSDNRVYGSYLLGLNNLSVSTWLKELVEKKSNKACGLVRNGIDITLFSCNIPYKNRKKHSIAFMFSLSSNKGFIYGFECIKRLKQKYPDLTVDMFGIEPWNNEYSTWIKYYECATEKELSKIFNENRLYLCSSLEEGFGLTGLESMACGSVLISTNTKGVFEYAVHKENALLSPIKDIETMFNNAEAAFENENFAEYLSLAGQTIAHNEFDITKSYEEFDKYLEGLK